MFEPKEKNDLEVTGVSRSGRVRKKSSKLVDFESPDDITESKAKRQKAQQLHAQQLLERFEQQRSPSQHVPQNVPHSRKSMEGSPMFPVGKVKQEMKPEPVSDEAESSGSDSEDGAGTMEEERYSMGDSGSDDEVDPLMIDEREMGFKRLEPPEQEMPSQARSLYMMEKCKKKLIIKDGKIIRRVKAQRKDKGRTRFTAYMLWAKDVRQDLIEKNPHMDFATISKRLGELWATVPNVEKYNWRRRAKRLAAKMSPQTPTKTEPSWKNSSPSSRKKLNNHGAAKDVKSPKKTIQLGVPSMVGNYVSPPSNRTVKSEGTDASNSPFVFKASGTQPIDVAAHLKLLGESLTIIGERLEEHEGQIAVSGTLSVLLDSLLCALGPLMCLTQQIPEIDGTKPEILSQMLENIAYIMPGL